MKIKMLFGVAAMLLAMGTAYQLSADPIVTPGFPLLATGDNSSQAVINDAVDDLCSEPGACPELYKMDVGAGSDVGPFADSYETTYIPPGDPEGAIIEWVGLDFITDPNFLLVKDGRQIPAWYIYDISAWDGMATITLSGFWPDNGAISHVAIYGGGPGGGDDPVPEPSTFILLGTGILGFAVLRRSRK